MATPPVCTIDAAGIHRPTFDECLAYYADSYRGIYGQDIVLDNDTQDGQWIKVQADALHQANGIAVAVFNAFSPRNAQGANLSRLSKLNGLTRKVASRSTVDVHLIGTVGTVIAAGVVSDAAGTLWDLPPDLVIPFEGELVVTATARDLGAVTAARGSITEMPDRIPGWQSVDNPEPATPGAPIERDSALRARQKASTTKPAQTMIDSIAAEIANLTGVIRVKTYENLTRFTNANGLPPGASCFVVEGGDLDAIADAIGRKKAGGGVLFGNTIGGYTDGAGIARRLAVSRPYQATITYRVTLRKRAGYSSDDTAAIKDRLATWTLQRGIGERIVRARAYLPAQLYGMDRAATYELVSVEVARDGSTPAPADVVLKYDEAASCTADNVDVVFVP